MSSCLTFLDCRSLSLFDNDVSETLSSEDLSFRLDRRQAGGTGFPAGALLSRAEHVCESAERTIEDFRQSVAAERGFLEADDLEQYPRLSSEAVDFPKVVIAKWKLLRQAFERFRIKADAGEKEAFRRFCDSKEWLPGYAAYVTRGPLNGNVC